MTVDPTADELDPAPANHNGGPPLDDHRPPWGRADLRSYFAWRAARRALVADLSYDVILRRARRAAACGLTFDEYQSEILFSGRHLQPGDREAIDRIVARRKQPAQDVGRASSAAPRPKPAPLHHSTARGSGARSAVSQRRR